MQADMQADVISAGAGTLDQFGNDPRKKELKILIWRIITVVMILICAVVLIYFVIKGAVWIYDKFFGGSVPASSAPASQQQQLPASPFGPNSAQSSDLNPPPMPVSFFNVVPLPQSPAAPALLPDNGSSAPVLSLPSETAPQNQNPAAASPGPNANSPPNNY